MIFNLSGVVAQCCLETPVDLLQSVAIFSVFPAKVVASTFTPCENVNDSCSGQLPLGHIKEQLTHYGPFMVLYDVVISEMLNCTKHFTVDYVI